MATVREPHDDSDHELTREEGWAMLEAEARHQLGLSAEEFIRAWDTGVFHDPDPDLHPGVIRVAMLLPLARDEGIIPAFERVGPA